MNKGRETGSRHVCNSDYMNIFAISRTSFYALFFAPSGRRYHWREKKHTENRRQPTTSTHEAKMTYSWLTLKLQGPVRIFPQNLQPQAPCNVSEPRLISQGGWGCEVVCAQISVFLQSERWGCQHRSAYVAAAVTWLRWDRKVCKTHPEVCDAKWRGLCGCNPAIKTAPALLLSNLLWALTLTL